MTSISDQAKLKPVIQPRLRGRRSALTRVAEFLVFTLPLLLFLAILYGTLLWNFYVSMANWVSTAANYTFTGLKWYHYLSLLVLSILSICVVENSCLLYNPKLDC